MRRYASTHPVCEMPGCGQPRAVVDHVIPRSEGGLAGPDNYQALCTMHNRKKTAAEGHRAWANKKAAFAAQFDFSRPHPGEITE